MVVAVYIDPLPTLPIQQYFIHKLVTELALQRPDYSFHLLVNNEWKDDLHVDNISITHIPVFGSFLKQYKTNNFLLKQINTIKAQVLLSFNGHLSIPDTPCYVFASDDIFLQEDQKLKNKQLEEIGNAKSIIVFSKKELEYLVDQNKGLAEKLAIVYGAAKELYHPSSPEEQSAVKERYTDGTEFLLYNGSLYPQHMVQLLKAFSLFKKRQKTTMKIVLATNSTAHQNELINLLGTYKYRADVVLQTDITELEINQLVGAAYAYINPFYERTLIPALSAMQVGCPVITTSDSAITEFSIDGALYYARNDTTDLSEKMMRMYKDEETRSRLIEKGFELNKNFSWQQTVGTILKEFQGQNS